jgi:hypothetical protein
MGEPPSEYSIRNRCVSLVKHTLAIYATLAFLFSGVASGAGWQPGVGAARAYAEGRLGTVSFAVRTERRLYGVAVRRTVPTASVLKAMLLVAYLRRPALRERRLRRADRALLRPMVRWSDNATASRVRDIVGNGGLVRLARRARLRSFVPAGLLRRGRRRVSVAILTTGNPSHAYAKRTLGGAAARLLRGLRPNSRPR